MKKLISILSAFLLCAFAYGANVYTNSFVRDGVTYVQRGVLTAKDYVVTNVVGGGGGGAVNSVNGKTGDVVLNAQDVGAFPFYGGIITNADLTKKTSITVKGAQPDEPDILSGDVTISGGDTYNGGEITIGGGYFGGGKLNIYGGDSSSSEDFGINISPNWASEGRGYIIVNGTNVMDAISGAGKVKSVNGETGDVVINEVNSATNWIDKPWWIEDNFAALANEANYSTEAGHVPWNGIEEKPDWIGNTKPTYTPQEIGAAPSKIKMDIIKVYGIDSEHYEIQLNGVRQTYQQIYDYATTREVSIARSNALYKPTYIGQNEMMFDCTGTIQNEAASRMIHIFRTPETVQLTDTKYLADKEWVLGLSTTYALTNQIVALNQSVQYVTAMGGSITPLVPANVPDGVRDWVIYVNAVADTQLKLDNLPSVYVNDASVTNNLPANKVTALYITEILKDKYMLGRQELIPVK